VKEADVADLSALIDAVRRAAATPSRLYLLARTSHLAEGWSARSPQLQLAGEGAPSLERAARDAAARLGVDMVWESPADVIPLPAGCQDRARPVPPALGADDGFLEIRHFDPYSVVLRLIARGDEPDYVVSLEYVRRGWVEPASLERLLGHVLPRFTNATLAQDPAEFRRKFRGLRQLLQSDAGRSRVPGTKEPAWV
jgi:hypothetical protein